MLAGHCLSDLLLFGEMKRIVGFDPEVPNRAFKFGVA
jgi:hypothetical protein